MVIPTSEGFEVVEQRTEIRKQREWNTIFPGCFELNGKDESAPFYILKKTGEVVRNLELVCVDLITAGGVAPTVGKYYGMRGREVYDDAIDLADGNGLPFVALSKGSIETGKREATRHTYLAQLYKERI